MGHSRADKEASHARIVERAARRFRERGLDGIGVADLMREAGLTHGGFYRHFDSRDALVEQALEAALAEGEARMEAAFGRPRPFRAIVEGYLSPKHRDEVAAGCALAALAPDVARARPEVRGAFARQVERTAATLQRALAAEGRPASRADALAVLTALTGALALSRAVEDPALSAEVLAAAKARLLGPTA
jgi:TetR/AcrR family transcriptional repressor of nem operon